MAAQSAVRGSSAGVSDGGLIELGSRCCVVWRCPSECVGSSNDSNGRRPSDEEDAAPPRSSDDEHTSVAAVSWRDNHGGLPDGGLITPSSPPGALWHCFPPRAAFSNAPNGSRPSDDEDAAPPCTSDNERTSSTGGVAASNPSDELALCNEKRTPLSDAWQAARPRTEECDPPPGDKDRGLARALAAVADELSPAKACSMTRICSLGEVELVCRAVAGGPEGDSRWLFIAAIIVKSSRSWWRVSSIRLTRSPTSSTSSLTERKSLLMSARPLTSSPPIVWKRCLRSFFILFSLPTTSFSVSTFPDGQCVDSS
mmetsp:Transcript_50531/g.141484  ORF Transcript_50531/g.141484 Transcript_50531/m.141484 type:complete len:312 (+) Transcript_50531:638-1573(+)